MNTDSCSTVTMATDPAPAHGVRRHESPLSAWSERPQRRLGPAHSKHFTTGALLLLGLAFHTSYLTPQTFGQQFAIEWFKIAGGGATAPSSGGVYALSGTIGQVDTGRVATTNDQYRLESGFWAIAIQQLGYPELNITQSGTNALVSWVTTETGLLLQSATDLATPAAWANTGFVPVLTGGVTNTVTVPLNPAQKQFFRLRRP